MATLYAIFAAILQAICDAAEKGIVQVSEDAITGKLSAPTVIHNAIPTTQADAIVGDALVDGVLPAQ